ncbi:Hypothetical protein SRAE_1000027600 [Strongyloides ratti]|uniref:Uncharacterized protein n=1 Tax=Strongyloides ratti TaxID=34506 RepID=A0A090KWW4_STRRB|nr:Hypothetical protein SRAE_1000027600 [Strongyloides ratti]CEF62000.1 Hypothetical protein SRAE_1000027600 [Strongyloides ratti]
MINQILSIDNNKNNNLLNKFNVNQKKFMPIGRSKRYASPYDYYNGYYGTPVYYQQPIYYSQSSYYNPLSAFCLFCARPSGFSFIEVG